MTANQNNPPLLKISQVAELAGVSKQTIEYYIMVGLLRPARDPVTRRRKFIDADVRRVKLIHRLNRTGYTLRDIRTMWLRGK